MNLRFFSDRDRPVHLGPYPLERLRRGQMPNYSTIPAETPLAFEADDPASLINAMREFQAMMDAIRHGPVNPARANCPADPVARAQHLKAFGYFSDAAQMGIGRLTPALRLTAARHNPDIDALSEALKTRQTKTLAAGIDMIMADLRDAMTAPQTGIDTHRHVIVILRPRPRPPRKGEPGTDWLAGAERHVACLRATEVAAVLANYIRLLGFEASAHTTTSSDIDLNRSAVAAGLASVEGQELCAPFIGSAFEVAAVTTTFEIATDAPLAPRAAQSWAVTQGPAWWLGTDSRASAFNTDPYKRRNYVDGPHPFETLKRVDDPTTFIDPPNIPRVPKRTDMFARAQFGDMGAKNQKAATAGYYSRKAAPSMAQRRLLGAFVLLQDGEPAVQKIALDPGRAAQNIKAASYFLGLDATGLSRCPDWAWYSHDARGAPILPPHDQAICMIVDQGFETMEGASGDDWISVAQSMRAYLRFSLLGGVIARQLRNLGHKAKAHTVIDGEVLQPPLLLLSGLGEVSRIGEVILNPFLGPRLKSGVVTTDLPLAHDKPIDFGLQSFCEACNKCARECPAGAITAGPKRMFNGYEIWKSDSQKCTTYRITTPGGAMCGRCMKTCPWNLEGLFAEKPFRWAAMKLPRAAPLLAKLDDRLGHGGLNPVKKWWWDLQLAEDGGYHPTREPVNARDLERNLDLRHEDQTLAIYPAPLAPHPYPYPFAMDREAGIKAYSAMISAAEHQKRTAAGETAHLHRYPDQNRSPVIEAVISHVEEMAPGVTKYEFRAADAGPLPEWTAGAHIDIVVAPEYLRQYSMSGNPANRDLYQIGVLHEDGGRGGSKLLHRIFRPGRRVFLSHPINHFPLIETAPLSLLLAGGIGITPMIAMAHRLHALGREFELHYAVSSRGSAGYLDDLAVVPWASAVQLHVSAEGSRADLDSLLSDRPAGCQVYTCGPERFMTSVTDAASRQGIPEEACHIEYFAVPEAPDWVNAPFTLKLSRTGRTLFVPADKSATDILTENGVHIDVKCADGICGVCKCGLIGGAVEHRDFVLSKAQREREVILCQSRAAEPRGVIEVDL